MESYSEQIYYDILEAHPYFTKEEIHNSYINAKQVYNSKNGDLLSTFTEQEIKDLNILLDEAYEVLRSKTLEHNKSLPKKEITSEYKKSQNELLEKYSNMIKNNYTIKEESAQSLFDKLESNSIKREKITETKEVEPPFDTSKIEMLDGSLLKKIRESKNIGIEMLSSTSKVNISYLKAIEENTFECLPAPVFIRGFVVSYAQALGLDTKKIANSYMAFYKKTTQI